MIKAHKIKLNPTPEQEQYFYRAAGVARFAWNWALTEYKRRKEAGEEIDWNEKKKEFRAKIDSDFPFNGKVLSGRIKQQHGSWFLIVTIEPVEVEHIQPEARPLRSVGIDPGLNTYAVLSDESENETQAHYRQAEDRVKRLQRSLARKKKGSKNRAK
jgi:transposase